MQKPSKLKTNLPVIYAPSRINSDICISCNQTHSTKRTSTQCDNDSINKHTSVDKTQTMHIVWGIAICWQQQYSNPYSPRCIGTELTLDYTNRICQNHQLTNCHTSAQTFVVDEFESDASRAVADSLEDIWFHSLRRFTATGKLCACYSNKFHLLRHISIILVNAPLEWWEMVYHISRHCFVIGCDVARYWVRA